MAHDAFQVAATAAAAIGLFGIERNDHVSALPDAFGLRVTAKTNALSQGPDADEAFPFGRG